MKVKSHAPRKRGMNSLEQAWASQLELLKRSGKISDYRYEPIKLRLADRTTYTPDFLVVDNEGYIRFDETKGFMRDDANVKLKVAAEQYQMFKFNLVTKDKGIWNIKEI